ncbi:MAG TPA: RMD1 family protein [Bradyrhizobium sp.]|nr:RMD1 family protein [Bradyrhizobium sp.]
MRAFVPHSQVMTAHAIQVGDRINTTGFEGEILSNTPLSLRISASGVAVLFRYGVVVLIDLSPQQERDFLEKLSTYVSGKFDRHEEETATIRLTDADEDQVPVGGPIQVKSMSHERLLVISDVLAKSVVLAHDERQVASVFEVIEPFARELAMHGKARLDRTGILKLIGNALWVQHRVSGRVAIAEKPDALWDRPDLERLYARLEDEYELRERVEALNRKLAVISETANTLGDIIDTQRSLRLELIIIALIAFEVVIAFYQILVAGGGH